MQISFILDCLAPCDVTWLLGCEVCKHLDWLMTFFDSNKIFKFPAYFFKLVVSNSPPIFKTGRFEFPAGVGEKETARGVLLRTRPVER
jgi:hypothetical protein